MSVLAALGVGLSFLAFAGAFALGYREGYSDGYDAGTEDAEEALDTEEQALDAICRTLDTDRAGFRALMRTGGTGMPTLTRCRT